MHAPFQLRQPFVQVAVVRKPRQQVVAGAVLRVLEQLHALDAHREQPADLVEDLELLRTVRAGVREREDRDLRVAAMHRDGGHLDGVIAERRPVQPGVLGRQAPQQHRRLRTDHEMRCGPG